MMAEAGEGDAGEAAIRWMTAEYERFPVQIGAQRAVRQVITLLGRGRPVLVHCFAGRTEPASPLPSLSKPQGWVPSRSLRTTCAATPP